MRNMNTAVSTLSPQVYVQLPDIEAHLQPPSSTNLEDVHICGTCKHNFSDINLFIEHKRTGCLSSPQKKTTAMAPSLTQSTVGYLTTPSGSEDGVSILGPPYLRVILDGGSLAVPQSNEHSQQDLSCGRNQESQILRSRLLGQHPVAVTVQQPNYNNSSDEMQTLVLQQQQQQQQHQQPQQHSRREFHIDEEDVATLLANQFTNEAVNSVHGTSISTSRTGLLSLENDIIIPQKRDGLDLTSISLSEGESGPLMLESDHKQGRNVKDRGKISSRNTSLGPSPTAAHEVVGARDKFWGQSNNEQEVQVQTTSTLLSTDNSAPTTISINAPTSPKCGKRRHDCPMDDCTFNTFYVKDLVRHMRKHTGERPFQCNACQRTFSRGDKLQMHLRIHSGEKPHRCQQCDYATIDSGSLRKHMRIHNDERPFKCQICPYRSRDTSQLTVHLRTHTGDNPFVCPYENCPSAFKTSSDLKRHSRMHTGEKPFSCELCNYRCAIKSNLRVHVRLNHVEVKSIHCSTCGYVATSKRDAKEHEKIHSEEVLKCTICSYSCMNSAGMKSHLKVHTQDKPFACKFCSYTCRQQSNLKNHIKKKHPDTRASRKGKGKGKETTSSAKGSSSSRISASKSYVHSKPFCVKSHQCTFCEAAFVREDSWRSHIRQHQTQDPMIASQTQSSEVDDRSSTAVEILSKAAAEVGAACDQERAVAMMGNDDANVQQDLLETDSFLSIQMNEAGLKGDRFGQHQTHNNNSLHLEENCKISINGDSFMRSIETEKDKEPQIVQQASKQEIIDASALQAQPILLYLQNASVVDGAVGDSLRSAEILASLNQTGSILVAGRCGQYLSVPVDQNNSLMEQLAASLQPGMQYVLSGPLEGMVGAETTFIQTTADVTTSTSSESTTVPLQSIISVQVDKGAIVGDNH